MARIVGDAQGLLFLVVTHRRCGGNLALNGFTAVPAFLGDHEQDRDKISGLQEDSAEERLPGRCPGGPGQYKCRDGKNAESADHADKNTGCKHQDTIRAMS